MEDKYITKKVSVAFLARDTCYGPPLYPQNISTGIKVIECKNASTE